VPLCQAVMTLQRVPMSVGRRLYGPNYRDKDYFNRVHLYFGGQQGAPRPWRGAGREDEGDVMMMMMMMMVMMMTILMMMRRMMMRMLTIKRRGKRIHDARLLTLHIHPRSPSSPPTARPAQPISHRPRPHHPCQPIAGTPRPAFLPLPAPCALLWL
jgi:hypothetical protein